MKCDTIVGIAEKIQTTSKPSANNSGPLPRKPNPDIQWSPGDAMQSTKSDWKAPPNIEVAKRTAVPHPIGKHSINFAHFPDAKPVETNYKQHDIITDKEK